ncbi:unnamed protein product, partial [Polarella glacialis]
HRHGRRAGMGVIAAAAVLILLRTLAAPSPTAFAGGRCGASHHHGGQFARMSLHRGTGRSRSVRQALEGADVNGILQANPFQPVSAGAGAGGIPIEQMPSNITPGPFDGIIMNMLSMSPFTASIIETFIFGTAAILTVISAKVNWDEWSKNKAEEDEIRRQKIMRALNPDGWKKELMREETFKAERTINPERGFN